MSAPRRPLLYDELASWFHLLTPPEDYADEAAYYRDALVGAAGRAATLLELGSGGGNNASHLKTHFRCTLTDVAPAMLEESRRINPECEHVVGDMRSLRLGRTFDAVLVHDAVAYLTTEADLRAAVATAFVHCRRGGAALFAPDCTRETFSPRTEHGGRDAGDRGLRYLEWAWDPDPTDSTYLVEFAYLLREGPDVRAVYDRHVLGLFARATWRKALADAGFEERAPRPPSANVGSEVFLVVRP